MTQPSRTGRAWRWLFAALVALACLPALGQSAASRIAEHAKTGFSLTGMHTSARCEDCHQQGVFRGTPRDCASCHIRGARMAGSNVVMPPQHMPTQATCETCHNTVSFAGARFNHMGVTRDRCGTCHNGIIATGKPMTPVHAGVTTNCGDCHRSTVNWMSARPDHSLFNAATNCTACHNGSSATGKTPNHMPTTANCIACHTVVTWKPSTWNHSQMPVANQCSNCHNGTTASGKTANHIPYQMLTGVAIGNCDACHRAGYTNWAPGYFHRYVTVTNQCALCHLTAASGLTSKPNTPTHAGVTGNCESCHKSTASWFSTTRPDHSLFNAATNCAACHNGAIATGKTATHMPTGTANCIACHTVVAWKPATWNHTQMPVANQCSNCHNGSTASGKTANHVPYQVLTGVAIANCDTCHRAGYTNWAPGWFHRYVTVSNQCSTCHLTAAYGLTAKPNTQTHVGVTGNCETCHRSTAAWTPVTYVHLPQNAVGTGTCDNCHLGQVAAVTKPASHIPVPAGTKCDACHLSQVSFATSVTMNHSAVSIANCNTCHNGAYVSQGSQGALAKPANHIPEAQLLNGATLDCKACHTSTVSWTSEKMNHNGSMGNGAGWCKACHQTGTSYLGTMQRMALNHAGGSQVKTDCSQSGCHRPLGNTGSTYIRWN